MEWDLQATFLIRDALTLKELPEDFDRAIDSGLFHVFNDKDRRLYVEGLGTVLKPGGRLFLLCFDDEETATQEPLRVSRNEIKNAFATGWKVESIERSRFDVQADLKGLNFRPGGPKTWFVVVTKTT